MDRFTSAQEQGHENASLKVCKNATSHGTNLDHQHQQPLPTSENAPTTPTITSPAITATFNTTELLEQILSYLPAPHLLTSKSTSQTFRNAIEASPMLRRKTSTYLRLGAVDEESDLFNTDAGGEVVFSIKGLESLAFFYPADVGERRLFVRFEVGDSERFLNLGRVGKAAAGGGGGGFGGLRVVDQGLGDVRVGWHCGCFEEGWGEVEVVCSMTGVVSFGDVFGAMEGEHRGRGREGCGSLRKVWVDGLGKWSGEMREFGR